MLRLPEKKLVDVLVAPGYTEVPFHVASGSSGTSKEAKKGGGSGRTLTKSFDMLFCFFSVCGGYPQSPRFRSPKTGPRTGYLKA